MLRVVAIQLFAEHQETPRRTGRRTRRRPPPLSKNLHAREVTAPVKNESWAGHPDATYHERGAHMSSAYNSKPFVAVIGGWVGSTRFACFSRRDRGTASVLCSVMAGW
jgi:hypothetical protein